MIFFIYFFVCLCRHGTFLKKFSDSYMLNDNAKIKKVSISIYKYIITNRWLRLHTPHNFFFLIKFSSRPLWKTTFNFSIGMAVHRNSHKKIDNLETRVELTVLRIYVGNKAILEPILLYWASKCKQTKEQGSEDCLWTYIFTFL